MKFKKILNRKNMFKHTRGFDVYNIIYQLNFLNFANKLKFK